MSVGASRGQGPFCWCVMRKNSWFFQGKLARWTNVWKKDRWGSPFHGEGMVPGFYWRGRGPEEGFLLLHEQFNRACSLFLVPAAGINGATAVAVTTWLHIPQRRWSCSCPCCKGGKWGQGNWVTCQRSQLRSVPAQGMNLNSFRPRALPTKNSAPINNREIVFWFITTFLVVFNPHFAVIKSFKLIFIAFKWGFYTQKGILITSFTFENLNVHPAQAPPWAEAQGTQNCSREDTHLDTHFWGKGKTATSAFH